MVWSAVGPEPASAALLGEPALLASSSSAAAAGCGASLASCCGLAQPGCCRLVFGLFDFRRFGGAPLLAGLAATLAVGGIPAARGRRPRTRLLKAAKEHLFFGGCFRPMPFPGVSQRFEPAIKERRKRAHTPAERRTSLDALDVVACRGRPVDAPTAWNRREARFWSRMVTCTATLRDGLTTRMRSCIRQGHINICNSSAELI